MPGVEVKHGRFGHRADLVEHRGRRVNRLGHVALKFAFRSHIVTRQVYVL